MWRASDAVVDAADLAAAVEEVEHGEGPAIFSRLQQNEPHLAVFLETVAAQLARPATEPEQGMEAVMDRLITIVRALELGHGRLWRDVLPRD